MLRLNDTKERIFNKIGQQNGVIHRLSTHPFDKRVTDFGQNLIRLLKGLSWLRPKLNKILIVSSLRNDRTGYNVPSIGAGPQC